MDSSRLATALDSLPASSRPLRSWVTCARALPQEALAKLLEELPPAELAQLQAELVAAGGLALEPRTNRYVQACYEAMFPSGPQRAFLCLDHVEHILYGGSAGGGKSLALLGAALQYVDVPGYAAMLFRKTYADLVQPDALIPKSRRWLGRTDAHWSEKDKQWTFPSGAVLKFGYLEHRGDEENYQGAAAQFWGFDEAGQLEPWQMDYLTSRARRTKDATLPIRFRYSANPGGRAHHWLVAKFMASADPQALFIPARAEDNPGLDVADYVARLSKIQDPILRAQLRDGDWKAVDRSGLVVPEWTDSVEAAVLDAGMRATLPPYFTSYVSVDTGSKDLTVYLFAYYDFIANLLVVEDELVFRDPNTREMGEGVVAKEAERWGAPRAAGRVDGTVRCADGDGRYLRDMAEPPYRLEFTRTEKQDAEHFRRACRADLVMGRIAIHPRCKHLVRTLKYARKKENGEWERTQDLGHADAWASLAYLHRNVSWGRNPYPAMVPARSMPGTYVQQPRHQLSIPDTAAELRRKYLGA